MANPVQWSIDQFFAGLQSVWSLANKASQNLTDNRTHLMRLWDVTKTQPASLRTANQALLTPLIHQNSVLRTQYLGPLKAKYMEAVNAGSAVLRQAGYTAPTLGLGILPALVIVPAAAIALVVFCLSAVAIVNRMTEVQIRNSANAAAIIGNNTLSPEQRAAELAALAAANKAAADDADASNPFKNFSLDKLVPVLGIVALIVLAPTITKLVPQRRTA